jgi:hypothetical protein
MTAIAYRDGVMAADSLTGGEHIRRGTDHKIARSSAGTIAGAAGYAGMCSEFRRWVQTGRIDEWIEGGFPEPLPIKAERNGFGAIVVTAAGRVICVDYEGRAIEIDAPFYVEGSAEEILLGAMAAGAGAEDAVRIAIQYDRGCGGPVQVERLR